MHSLSGRYDDLTTSQPLKRMSCMWVLASMREEITRLKQYGCFAWLSGPFDPDALANTRI